jgi:CBS domain-containing protein
MSNGEKKEFKNIKDVCVCDIYQLVANSAATVHRSMMLENAVKAMVGKPMSQKVYVVDNENKLVGSITMQTVLRRVGYIYGVRKIGVIPFFKFLSEVLRDKVEEIMDKEPIKVTKDAKVLDALKLMVQHHLNNLPVVDKNNILIGELDGIEILKGALKGEKPSSSVE